MIEAKLSRFILFAIIVTCCLSPKASSRPANESPSHPPLSADHTGAADDAMEIDVGNCDLLPCTLPDEQAMPVAAVAHQPTSTHSSTSVLSSAEAPNKEPWTKFYASGTDLVRMYYSNKVKPDWYLRIVGKGMVQVQPIPATTLQQGWGLELPADIKRHIESMFALQVYYIISPKIVYTTASQLLGAYRISKARGDAPRDYTEKDIVMLQEHMNNPPAKWFDNCVRWFNDEYNIYGSDGRLGTLRERLMTADIKDLGRDRADWTFMTATEARALVDLLRQLTGRIQGLLFGAVDALLLDNGLKYAFKSRINGKHNLVIAALNAALKNPEAKFLPAKPQYDWILKASSKGSAHPTAK